MSITPFFMELHAAYQAELDDLATDSEGSLVLTQRLQDKRAEIGFLVQMMEFNPEMVAVVFHRGFRFGAPGLLEQVLTLEADEFPAWETLRDTIELQPWARDLADFVLDQPAGEWFLTVAAALEYLQVRSLAAPEAEPADETAADAPGEGESPRRSQDRFGDDDTDDDVAERLSEEAGADWLAEQGFDRKE